MDDKKITDGMQQTNEVPQPIYETVPVDPNVVEQNSLQPEEVSQNVAETDQGNNGQLQPEVVPIADEPPAIYQEKSKLPFIAIGAVVFVVILLIVVMVFAKKSTIPPSPQTTSLVYWGLWEDKEVMDALIKEYQKSNPQVKIQYEKKDPTDYLQKLLVWTQKGQGPDIFRFHNTWLPEVNEITAPLPDSVMTASQFEKTFYPVQQKDLKIGTKYYGLPTYIDGLVLLCNQDLLKKAGVVTIPSNWDDLIVAANKVLVKEKDGHIITAGLAGGTATNVEHFSDIFGLMLMLNGGSLSKLDEAEAAGALEAYRRFAEEPNNVWSEDMPNSITAFAQGKVAMIFAPTWEIQTIKAAAPDLKIVVAEIPSPPGGKQVSLASYWVEGVSNKSVHQLEAWKFLAYLTSKEGETKLFEVQSSLRLFGTAYSRTDLTDLVIQHEYLGPVIKQALEDKFVSLPLGSSTFDDSLNDGIVQYIQNAINATSRGVSYTEALGTAKKGVDQIFSRYKIN